MDKTLDIIIEALKSIKSDKRDEYEISIKQNINGIRDESLGLDSLQLVSLLIYIENSLGKQLPANLLNINNFNTVNGIIDTISKMG